MTKDHVSQIINVMTTLVDLGIPAKDLLDEFIKMVNDETEAITQEEYLLCLLR